MNPEIPAARLAAHEPDSLWSAKRRPLTLGLVLTITLVASEALAVATAMPVVARDIGGLSLYGWVFSAFFLGSLIGISVVGGLIDERGIVVPFVGGLVLFGIGLLICGLAPSMEIVVVGRFVQGLGGGAVPPVAYVAIGRSLPDRLRPHMFAIMSAAWVLPGVAGPAVAGLIAEFWHWRVIFLGLLPFIVLSGTIASRAMRAIPPAGTATGEVREAAEAAASDAARADRRRRYGWAVLVAIGAALLTTGLLSADLAVLAGLTAGGLALTLVAFHRLTPPGTLRLARGYPAAVLLRGVLTFSFFAVDAYVALLLVEVRDWSAAAAGLALTGATVSWSLGSWIQSRTVGRVGAENYVRIGFPIVGLGLAGMALALVPEIPAWIAIPTFAVAGLGMGLSYSQFAIIVLRDAPRDRQGSVTAAISLSDALGTALGAGIPGAMIAAAVRAGSGPAPALAAAIAMAVGVAFLGFLAAPRLHHERARPAGTAESGSSHPNEVPA
ncbi:MAG TPA: MFS transporter [Candidatus Limnocylindrales bacterium]|nr:MFS transporter [Candidatus Limnocylindrales bacterium]